MAPCCPALQPGGGQGIRSGRMEARSISSVRHKHMNWTFLIVIVAVVATVFLLTRASFVAPGKARELLRQGALVVDVRNPGEFSSGRVPGAINIPLGALRREAPERLPDKGQAILLHCLSGTRSGIACRQLKKMGYTNVFNLGSYGRAEEIVRGASGT